MKKNKTSKKHLSKKQKKKILYLSAFYLCLIIFLGCAFYLITYFWDSKQSEDRVDELKEYIDSDDSQILENDTSSDTDAKPAPSFEVINGIKIQKKFTKLYNMNTDFIGWITIDGTDIDYPVMQSMYDEEFYLHKDFDKKYTKGGTLFADTSSDIEKPSDNIIIYGHNMTTGKMFHSLFEYEDEEFYKEHKYISFDTIYGNGTYEIIAAFRTRIYEPDYTGFKYYQFFDAANEEEFNYYVENCRSLTPYTTDSSAVYGDSLITLSTCAYHHDNGRYVVVAKKID